MVKNNSDALDRTFAALADPTRRAIVERLAGADRLSVSALATPFAMSLPAVLKHVGILTEAGLVAREKIGRTVYCRLEAAPMRDALRWLRRFERTRSGERHPPAAVEPNEVPPRSAGRGGGAKRTAGAGKRSRGAAAAPKRPGRRKAGRQGVARR